MMTRWRRKPKYLDDLWWKDFCSRNKVPPDAIFSGGLEGLRYEGRLLFNTPDEEKMERLSSTKKIEDFF